MNGSDLNFGSDFASKVAVNLLTEIFKGTFKGLKKAEEWFQRINKTYDPFGIAANKYTESLMRRYNKIKIFGMDKPVPLEEIYVRINILEKITTSRNSTIEDLETQFNRDKRTFGYSLKTRVGIDIINETEDSEIKNLMVLGKPGSGKTTFLKFITLYSLSGNFNEKRIPIFISLNNLSESGISILEFIIKEFDICEFPDASSFIERILLNGKCLILLDGLDEINDENNNTIKNIVEFTEKYYKNRFIVSCRVSAYTYLFSKFIDVEISDFDDSQIKLFVQNWYSGQEKKKNADHFLSELYSTNNNAIKELASIPLLLTMLCISFDESFRFPRNINELYKESIDALLKKWDASRNIKRANIYKDLTTWRKENLLSFIAIHTFEKKQYFFYQAIVEDLIKDYFKYLSIDLNNVDFDSELVLRTIESQHGLLVQRAHRIYSFSHLTFQEYFTAKYIVDNEARGTIAKLFKNYILDLRWRQIFILIPGMISQADNYFENISKKIEESLSAEIKSFLSDHVFKIIRDNLQFHHIISKLLAIYSFFESNHARKYSLQNNIALKNIRSKILTLAETFANVEKTIPTSRIISKDMAHDRERSLLYDLNLIVDYRSLEEIKYNFSQKFIDDLSDLLYLQKLLLDCMKVECLITPELRKSLLNNLI